MSIEHRRTEAIYAVITELVANGKTSIRPGDVSDVLREQNSPVGTWQVRAEFTRLEADGRLMCDEESGNWHLVENGSQVAGDKA